MALVTFSFCVLKSSFTFTNLFSISANWIFDESSCRLELKSLIKFKKIKNKNNIFCI
ncbi:hypothetical protein PUN28_008651 [Cardiocondyla obscurior]|uniref:Uncharacterized protein n=1 Tax=Cardiocondyla obscurior TaxID=286306 RepID=A0AAW2G0J7_9HYME